MTAVYLAHGRIRPPKAGPPSSSNCRLMSRQVPLKLTTAVRVLPDVLPYQDKDPAGGGRDP